MAARLVTHKPATALRLAITISGQYGGDADGQNVAVEVQLFEGDNPQPAVPSNGAKMTCNGVDVIPDYDVFSRPCPRQPPGGAYHITYTNEHGVATTTTVTVPQGTLALLSPYAGEAVPIPGDGALEIRYSTPVAPTGGDVSVDTLTASSDMPYPHAGGEVNFTRQSATDGASTATSHGGEQTFRLAGNFAQFQPGAGSIEMTVSMWVIPAGGGFDRVTAAFSDTITTPITWTASPQ